MVTVKSFYGSSTGHYDTVLVSVERNEEIIVGESNSKEVPVRFGKALAFESIELEELESGICETHGKSSRLNCTYNAKKELCIAQ